MTEQQMYIAGEWVNSSDNNFSDAINPATGEVIAKFPKQQFKMLRDALRPQSQRSTILLGKILTQRNEVEFSTRWLQQPIKQQKTSQK